MPSLSSILQSEHAAEALVADCTRFVERLLDERSGARGMALRAGVSMLQAARPDVLRLAVGRVLPEALISWDPLYAAYTSERPAAQDFGAYLDSRRPQASKLLMEAVDRVAANVHNPLAKSLYRRFRSSAGREVASVVPEFGRLLARHR